MMANTSTYVKNWLLAAFLLPLLGYCQGLHSYCGPQGVCLQRNAPCTLVVANPNCEEREKCCVFKRTSDNVAHGIPDELFYYNQLAINITGLPRGVDGGGV
ncbi:uncharacterized protein LOC121404115 [Drosophila obscura]|uniref:uncharacterized protein LOC121404115 n=1 Tax=Drosophila obscura TaxID=7282 RepID=UPI001BB10A39|nr:uncharacterized protein LOC121404115 [Drosophila obscura]